MHSFKPNQKGLLMQTIDGIGRRYTDFSFMERKQNIDY